MLSFFVNKIVSISTGLRPFKVAVSKVEAIVLILLFVIVNGTNPCPAALINLGSKERDWE